MNGFISFICEHNDPNLKEQYGLGIANGQFLAVDEQGNPQFYVTVLWTDANNVSPSVHKPEELSWVMLTEQYLALEEDDDDDENLEEGNEEGNEEGEEEVDFDVVDPEADEGQVLDH